MALGMVSKLDIPKPLSRSPRNMAPLGLHGHGVQWPQSGTGVTNAKTSTEMDLALVLLILLMGRVLTGSLFGRLMVVKRPSPLPLNSSSEQTSNLSSIDYSINIQTIKK